MILQLFRKNALHAKSAETQANRKTIYGLKTPNSCAALWQLQIAHSSFNILLLFSIFVRSCKCSVLTCWFLAKSSWQSQLLWCILKEMLNLVLQFAFQITGAEAVQWNVFNENSLAKHCYEKVGFVERNIDKDVFSYQDELWSRCNMIVSKQSF